MTLLPFVISRQYGPAKRAEYRQSLDVGVRRHSLYTVHRTDSNLVINDVNKMSKVRNVVGTVKEIIQFFRESSQHQKLVPNVPMLCETRWTHNYRNARLFSENFVHIAEMLTCLATTAR